MYDVFDVIMCAGVAAKHDLANTINIYWFVFAG